MKFLLGALLIFASPSCFSQWSSFQNFPPLEEFYHPITTKSKEAQEAFNRGLLAIYAFNYDESVKSFDEVTQLDPECAMGYWGMALALDENLNAEVKDVHAKLTWLLYQKAEALSYKVTENEKAYIQALKSRFSENPKESRVELRKRFSLKMKDVAKEYPNDLDAAVIYAESLMDNLFWVFYEPNKEPKDGTEEILQILESVLIKNPFHPGANHYYIHAVEDSRNPERGLMSAYRIDAQDYSEWGHLIHTTSHIYLRVGSYQKAVETNIRAVQADKQYIEKNGLEGKYPLKYLAHNLYYLTIAYAWQEDEDKAVASAKELEAFIFPNISIAPVLEYNLIMPMQVYLYFHRWKDVLALPEPDAKFEIVKLFWMFARALAYAHTSQFDKMKEEQQLFLKQKEWIYKRPGSQSMKETFDLAKLFLLATVAKTKNNFAESISLLERAVQMQEEGSTHDWFHPLQQTLGSYLLEAGQFEKAEAVFREGLKRHPRNGRLLYGLFQSLQKQGKFDYWINREEKEALQYATKQLRLKDF